MLRVLRESSYLWGIFSPSFCRNQNFSGEDTIRASARNANGKNDLDIPVVVEPINDSPFFKVPEFVILKFNSDEALIFDRKRDKFDFFAGDPDLLHFPGFDP